MRKPGLRGLKGKLISKSIEAYILSLETINRLSIAYRVETFAYLVCNAWELLLKAKLIEDTKSSQSIFYPKKKDAPIRSLSLRDSLIRVFPQESDPVRRNLEKVANLRDEAVHLIISDVPKEVLTLFQACVLNYHKRLQQWFGIALSDRVPIGMMTIVYDFSPEQFDMQNPIMRRKLGRDAADYLLRFQEEVLREYEELDRTSEFSIDLSHKLALIDKPDEAELTLTKGTDGKRMGIVEVPKDPARTHPWRHSDLVDEINARIQESQPVTIYDVQCVIDVHNIKKRSEFFYQSTVKGSPGTYSVRFIEWVALHLGNDPDFLSKARATKRQKDRKRRSDRVG